MKFHPVRLIVVMIAVVGLPQLLYAETYRDAANRFQLELPEGWRALAADELSRFNKGTKNTSNDGAFRPIDKFFGSAPYVLYRIHRGAYTGASYEDIEKDLVSGGHYVLVKREMESVEQVLKTLTVGQAYLDRTRNLLYMRNKSEFALGVAVNNLSVSHLSSSGSVQVIGYATDKEIAEFVPLFAKINESIKFDPGNEFKALTRAPAREPQSSSALTPTMLLVAVACALGALVVYSAQTRRKHPNTRANSVIHAIQIGGVVYLLFVGCNTAVWQRLPDVERLAAVTIDFCLASLLVGVFARGKSWHWSASAGAIFLLGLGFFVLSTFWFMSRSQSDLAVHEQWLKDGIKLCKECGDVLESVHDQESAERAVPQLNALLPKFDDLAEQAKKRIDVPKVDLDRVNSKYMPEVAREAKRMLDLSQSSVDKARSVPAFEDAIERLQKAYMKLRNS